MRFTVDGQAAYPLFQFDVERRRIHLVIGELIALKPDAWSDFRLLHWLTRPHLVFGGAPSEHLGPGWVDYLIAALECEIARAENG